MMDPVSGPFFTLEQLQPAGSIGDGDAGWWVAWGGSYRGRAVAPAHWTADQVLEGLNRMAGQLGEDVLKGRLYSRTRVDG